MTALLYDLQADNVRALEDAYFNKEIDFFLDYKGVQNTAARELYYIREAGKLVGMGNLVAARNFLRSVTKYPNEKQYVEAVILAAEGSYEQSMRAFKSLIEKRRKISRRLLNLAFMGAARVAHEVADYSQAIFYYSRVGQLDPLFFQSIFERGWSFYLDGDMNGALGATLSFMTPYSENIFYPETYIVRAAAFYQLCLFDRANQSIEDMKKVFIPLQAQIKELQRRQVESWMFEDKVLRSVDKRILGYMIANPGFRSYQRAFQSLRKETGRLGGAERVKAQEAYDFVRQRLARKGAQLLGQLANDVSSALEQADAIQIEILQLGVNVLTGAPVEMRDDIRIIELGDVDFDEQIQFWPFHKEFWLDELGSYYYGLRSQCQ
jgi:tetratricopeptide (TPR) repeat protein